MIFADDERWDERWDEIDAFSMVYETAVIPFSADGYLEEFYDLYEIRNRTPVLVPSEADFFETLKEVSGGNNGELIAAKTESLFGLPQKVMVFDDNSGIKDELEGPDGLAPFFFVFDMMFCKYDDFTLCFMSGTNN